MRTLLLSLLLLFAAGPAFAQGQLIFANNSATAITNRCTGQACAGGPEQNDTQVGLYIGNVGDPVSSLTLIGNVTNCFAPGRFSGGVRTLNGWMGTVQLQVRVWLASTVYPSFEAAVAAGLGGDTSVHPGYSAPFIFTLTSAPAPPVSIANGGLTAIVIGPITCIPEPSALMLGLLGLGAWAILRRSK